MTATHNVPDCLEFQPGEGGFQNTVYECLVCGVTITGTENAVDHGCRLPPACPVCGWYRARPSLGVGYGRVDDCQCGAVFRSRNEGVE